MYVVSYNLEGGEKRGGAEREGEGEGKREREETSESFHFGVHVCVHEQVCTLLNSAYLLSCE